MKQEKRRQRWYDDACGTAHALELIGERWSLLIMRELMLGARRFSELRKGLPGISANVLTQRLERFETEGLVRRRRLPSPTNADAYELTPWGYELGPIIQDLGGWAARSPTHDPTLHLSSVSIMMSMRTMLQRELSAGTSLVAAFHFGDDQFIAELVDSELHISRGCIENTDFVFRTTASTLATLLYGGRTIADAEAAGELQVLGSRASAELYLQLFSLPPKATR